MPLWEGKVEWQDNRAVLEVRNAGGKTRKEEMTIGSRPEATARLLEALTSGEARVLDDRSEINVVGHRIVNGGSEYKQPCVITPEVRDAIERMAVFAPLHNRLELEGIARARHGQGELGRLPGRDLLVDAQAG